MKEIRKTEKEKEENKIKIKKGPKGTIRPSIGISPQPRKETRSGIPLFSPCRADVWAPLARPRHLLPPLAEINAGDHFPPRRYSP
jgi:hypothetical protein